MKNPMRRFSQLSAERRDETVFRHTAKMLQETGTSDETFADRVVSRYLALVPADSRSIAFLLDETVDAFYRARMNAQKIMRYADPDANARLPAELEEAWVLELDEPYRGDCVRDLAKRYGLLDVPLPESLPASDVQNVSTLSKRFSDALGALAPLIEDGRIDSADESGLDVAMADISKLLATTQGLLGKLESIKRPSNAVSLPVKPKVRPIGPRRS